MHDQSLYCMQPVCGMAQRMAKRTIYYLQGVSKKKPLKIDHISII